MAKRPKPRRRLTESATQDYVEMYAATQEAHALVDMKLIFANVVAIVRSDYPILDQDEVNLILLAIGAKFGGVVGDSKHQLRVRKFIEVARVLCTQMGLKFMKDSVRVKDGNRVVFSCYRPDHKRRDYNMLAGSMLDGWSTYVGKGRLCKRTITFAGIMPLDAIDSAYKTMQKGNLVANVAG
jgi:hypothetical protein